MNSASNPVEIKAGTTDDLTVVRELMSAAFDAQYGEAWTVSQCLGMMTLPGVWLSLAYSGNSPAGFALSRAVADEAELLLLAIHPDFRRRGIGSTLLRNVIADARGRGAAHMHLEVRANNEAVHLYRSLGFEKVGQRRDYYRGAAGDLFDALTLSRIIT